MVKVLLRMRVLLNTALKKHKNKLTAETQRTQSKTYLLVAPQAQLAKLKLRALCVSVVQSFVISFYCE